MPRAWLKSQLIPHRNCLPYEFVKILFEFDAVGDKLWNIRNGDSIYTAAVAWPKKCDLIMLSHQAARGGNEVCPLCSVFSEAQECHSTWPLLVPWARPSMFAKRARDKICFHSWKLFLFSVCVLHHFLTVHSLQLLCSRNLLFINKTVWMMWMTYT